MADLDAALAVFVFQAFSFFSMEQERQIQGTLQQKYFNHFFLAYLSFMKTYGFVT